MPKKMKRREFMELMGAGMAVMTLHGCIPKEKMVKERPNILWISCEDISPDLGCYGNTEVSTPNIDRLASQGVRYSNVFTVAPVCSPNRSGMITCMYPTTIGSMHMRTKPSLPKYNPPGISYETVPPPYVKCFTEYLRAEGYYCTNRVKTDYQFTPPITAWDRNSRNHSDWKGRAEGQPFFCVINYEETHESRIRTPLDKEPIINPESVTLPPYYPDTSLVRRDWARYLDNIETLDKRVGETLEQLDNDGLSENTIVFFWSDHGRGLPRAKRLLYDGGTHVPLIVRWPGVIEPGTVRDDMISSIDLGATVLSIAGVEVPSYMQGQAFLGEQKGEPREYVFSQRDRMDEKYDMIRAVRDKRFKYIRNFQPEKPYAPPMEYADMMPTLQEMRRLSAEGKLNGPQKLFLQKTKPEEELYDTTVDRYEINNLADNPEYKDVLERMRKVLDNWMEETNDLGRILEKEHMENIWPGGVQPKTGALTINPNGGTFDGSVTVKISCPTEGASIAYTTEEGEDPHWLLYTKEIKLTKSARLNVRGIRIGYAESPEVQVDFVIK